MLRGMTVALGLSLVCCLPAGLRRMKASRGRKQVTCRMTRELLSGARTSGWDYVRHSEEQTRRQEHSPEGDRAVREDRERQGLCGRARPCSPD